MNATVTTNRSTETALLSPQQLGAFTRKAYAAGKGKPGWVQHVQQERADRAKLHARLEAENEANAAEIAARAQEIHDRRVREIERANARAAARKTAQAPKPAAPAKNRFGRTPAQQRAFEILMIKSGRR